MEKKNKKNKKKIQNIHKKETLFYLDSKKKIITLLNPHTPRQSQLYEVYADILFYKYVLGCSYNINTEKKINTLLSKHHLSFDNMKNLIKY